MAIPNTPQTRGEQYLNAIATGDTSGIPEAPQTREEMYLDAIAKGGGSSGGVLVVTATESDGVFSCDKTAAEMWAAYPVIILYDAMNNDVALCSSAQKEDDSYTFDFPDSHGERYYEAASGSDYPTYTPGE